MEEKRSPAAGTRLKLSSSEERVLSHGGSVNGHLIFAVVVIAFGSSFQFGYNIGNVNAAGGFIKQWMADSHNRTFGSELNAHERDLLFSTAVSLLAVGGLIGGLLVGWLADTFGRRLSLHLNNILSISAAAFMTFAKVLDFYPLFHVGRFLIGINAGSWASSSSTILASRRGLVPLFMTELSPIRLRGAFGSIPQLVVTISILLAQIVGLPQLFGTETRWPIIFALIFVPSVLQVIGLLFVPESPKYTLVFRHNHEQALRDLAKLRGSRDYAQLELRVIQNESAEQENKEKEVAASALPSALPLAVGPRNVALMVAQQLSGINAAMFYSTEIFARSGLPGELAVFATIVMAALNVSVTMLSVYLVEHPRFGRRSLLIIGKIGMACAGLGLVVSMAFNRRGIATDIAPLFSAVFLPAFVCFFAIGPGSIPLNLIHEFTFLIFVVVCIGAAVFVFRYLPETKQRSLREVQEEMERRRPKFC
ncbi:Protein CBR-FGT-1 [Aphelenchoides fujianensis]|nr:Protein CBR-FGT-1 [Aphelenchoides fujianensis]